MTFFRIYLIILAAFSSACKDSSSTNNSFSSSSELVNVPGVEYAFAGSANGEPKFIILPAFDSRSLGGRHSSLGSAYNGSFSGRYEDKENNHLDYDVRYNIAKFGEQEYDLSKGKVFILHSGITVTQIPDSIVGDLDSEENLNRLSQIFKKELQNHPNKAQ